MISHFAAIASAGDSSGGDGAAAVFGQLPLDCSFTVTIEVPPDQDAAPVRSFDPF